MIEETGAALMSRYTAVLFAINTYYSLALHSDGITGLSLVKLFACNLSARPQYARPSYTNPFAISYRPVERSYCNRFRRVPLALTPARPLYTSAAWGDRRPLDCLAEPGR